MEIVATYPPPGEPLREVTRVRSTLVTSGMANLRAMGLFDAWAAGVDPAARDELVTSIAGTWMPVRLALEYYRGCERLPLTPDEVTAIGQRVAAGMRENVFNTIKRIATGVGVTPWTLAAHFDRLWLRVMDGGGFRVAKLGPKDASIEIQRTPMAAFSYFRHAFCGFNLAATSLVAQACTARITSVSRAGDGFTIRLAWV